MAEVEAATDLGPDLALVLHTLSLRRQTQLGEPPVGTEVLTTSLLSARPAVSFVPTRRR